MPKEQYTCSLHLDEATIVEETQVHVHGHPGITEWHGTVGPTEVELDIGPAYLLKLADGRSGLIVIKAKRKSWGGATGNRYEFEGTGSLM